MAANSDDILPNLLRRMHATQASDLHLVPGNPPIYRVHGRLQRAAEGDVAPDAVERLLEQLLGAEGRARCAAPRDSDFAVQLESGGERHRFRVNVFVARGRRGACFRAIPDTIPSLAELGFPAGLAERVLAYNAGLVLVTGVTGSGKTTTLAAMLQTLNARGNCRIITIEEPIEYLYPSVGDSLVTQREVGMDVETFHDGLRSGLRQDPDVLLVGEIRDRETAQLALSAAETGHLIFGTLHSADAKGSLTRLIDLFPAERHDEIRTQLSMSLRAVIAQHLLPAAQGGRRVLALEVLLGTYAVRSALRQGRFESLDSAIQSGRQDGMFTLDADLSRLVAERRITLEVARDHAKDPAEIRP